jgi:S-adenosylmethionine:tRNA-ribosyltransferase-isomerase (queuine synthetase)
MAKLLLGKGCSEICSYYRKNYRFYSYGDSSLLLA